MVARALGLRPDRRNAFDHRRDITTSPEQAAAEFALRRVDQHRHRNSGLDHEDLQPHDSRRRHQSTQMGTFQESEAVAPSGYI